MNNVVLAGRLVADVEYKTMNDGKGIAKMRLAVDRGKDQPSDFIDLTAFQATADFASKYLAKGRKIGVIGKIRTREWQAEDGSKRRGFEVVCDQLYPLDSNKTGGGDAPAQPQSRPQAGGFDDIEDPFG
jgi:single-strand DNA-binding protein